MISDFMIGDTITGFFVLASVQLIPYDKGERLRLEFADSSGRIEGIVWDSAAVIYNQIKDAEVVKVLGVVSSYRDRMQFKIEKIRPAEKGEYDLTDLIPVVEGGIEKQRELFESIASTITNPFLVELIRIFKNDKELFGRYINSPAGKRWHHAYVGGLIQHSVSVAGVADRICSHYPELNRDLLICGALLHDVGKVYELSSGLKFDYTDEGRLIGHISIGDEIVASLISQIPDFPEKLNQKLRHIILSHHSEAEFGSPVKPQIREALILHLIDMMDSGLNVFGRYDEKTDGDWSEWVNLWERYLYFG